MRAQEPVKVVIALAMLALLLAGCVGGTDPGGASVGPVSNAIDPNGGSLEGVVTTEDLAPVAGARVTVQTANLTTNTSAEGRFRFASVPAGNHLVIVDALGYQSVARRVDVAAGGTTEVRLFLAELPVIEPRTEVILFRGLTGCDYNAIWFSYTLQHPGCEAKRCCWIVQVNASWRYAVLEQDWSGQDSMHLKSDTDGSCTFNNASGTNTCFRWRTGRSPLRIDAAPEDWSVVQWNMLYPAGAFKWNIAGWSAGYLQREINDYGVCAVGEYGGWPRGATCAGLAGSPGTAFELYVSIFHYERPEKPAAYSARPDR